MHIFFFCWPFSPTSILLPLTSTTTPGYKPISNFHFTFMSHIVSSVFLPTPLKLLPCPQQEWISSYLQHLACQAPHLNTQLYHLQDQDWLSTKLLETIHISCCFVCFLICCYITTAFLLVPKTIFISCCVLTRNTFNIHIPISGLAHAIYSFSNKFVIKTCSNFCPVSNPKATLTSVGICHINTPSHTKIPIRVLWLL